MRLLILGMGNSGRAIARRLAPRVERLWGTTRSPDRFAKIAALGATPLLFDGQSGTALDEALAAATHIVVSAPPGGDGDPLLATSRCQLVETPPECLIYLSTVGVYGNYDGAWIDETADCRPVSERALRRVAAERAWRDYQLKTGTRVAILRLSGIYGGGPKPFQKLLDGTARRIIKKDQVFNRIHVDDIANVSEAVFAHEAEGVFNTTDDEPAPPQDVVTFAAKLLGVDPPPEVSFEDAELSPMGRSFYSDNKRVSNRKIKKDLGVQLIYPTYREGLSEMIKEFRPEN